MIKMTFTISAKLKKEMERYPEINWSVVALAGIQRQLKILKEMENSTQKDIGRNNE
jgi:hypothetical protein